MVLEPIEVSEVRDKTFTNRSLLTVCRVVINREGYS
jgi:hypothetical protein